MFWYLQVLKKYAEFTGRARRKEYWMFALFNLIISLVLYSTQSSQKPTPHGSTKNVSWIIGSVYAFGVRTVFMRAFLPGVTTRGYCWPPYGATTAPMNTSPTLGNGVPTRFPNGFGLQ